MHAGASHTHIHNFLINSEDLMNFSNFFYKRECVLTLCFSVLFFVFCSGLHASFIDAINVMPFLSCCTTHSTQGTFLSSFGWRFLFCQLSRQLIFTAGAAARSTLNGNGASLASQPFPRITLFDVDLFLWVVSFAPCRVFVF